MGIVSRSQSGSGGGSVLFDSTLGADTASIDTGANGIVPSFNVLEVFIVARTDKAVVNDVLDITLNNDTAAVYDRETQEIANITNGGGPQLAQTAWHPLVRGASGGASYPSVIHLVLPSYAQTTFFKVGASRSLLPDQTAANNVVDTEAWGYRSAVAVSRMKVAAQGVQLLKAGSRLLIFGR